MISSIFFHGFVITSTHAFQSVENLGDKDLIWSYTYDEHNSRDAMYSIIQCHEGGFILVGSTGLGINTDVLLLRLSETGALEWNSTIEDDGIEIAQEVIECESGGYAVIGYKQESWAFGTNLGYDALLIRLNENGLVLWKRTIGGNESEQAYSIVECSDGGFAFAGYATNPEDGSLDFWLVRTNTTGHIMWDRTFGDVRNEICHSLMQSIYSQQFILVGTREITQAERQDGLIVIMSGWGALQWDQTFRIQDVTVFYDVVQSMYHGYTIVGTTEDVSTNNVDALVINIDTYGNNIWNVTFGSSLDDEAYSIFRCSNGGYAIAGFTQELIFHGHSQFWLVRLSAYGDVQWTKRYGGLLKETGWSVVQSSSFDFIIAGTTENLTQSEVNAWVIRVPDASPFEMGGSPNLNLVFLGVLFGIAILAGMSIVYARSRRELSSLRISLPIKHLRSTFYIPRTLQELTTILSGIVRCRHCGTIVKRNQMTCSTCSAQLHRCLFCDNIITDETLVIFCPNCRNLSHAHEMLAWLKIRNKCPVCGFRLKS